MFYFLLSHFLFFQNAFVWKFGHVLVWNYLEASILHVRSQKYCGIPHFFTNNSGIPHYFIMEFHIKNKLWKTEIKYYCPFIMNFHSCSKPRIVLNWGHMLLCWFFKIWELSGRCVIMIVIQSNLRIPSKTEENKCLENCVGRKYGRSEEAASGFYVPWCLELLSYEHTG